MKLTLWKVHRWLGVVACLGVLMWGLSGMLHPIMTRLQPKPATLQPPVQAVAWPAQAEVASWLAAAGIGQVENLHLVTLRGTPYLWAREPGQAVAQLLNLQNGMPIPNGERELAIELARHYTGKTSARVLHAEPVATFDADYTAVNQLLPVWRVQFAEEQGDASNLRAYVEPGQMRLATLVDDTRHTLTTLFRWGHTWAFLDVLPGAQVAIQALLLMSAFSTGVAGIWLFFRGRKTAAQRLSERALLRWHRRAGLLVALTLLSFSLSGSLHLLRAQMRMPTQQMAQALPVFSVQSLRGAVWQGLAQQPALSQIWLMSLAGRTTLAMVPAGVASAPAQVGALHRHDAHAEHAHQLGVDNRKKDTEVDQTVLLHVADGQPVAEGLKQATQALAGHYALTDGVNLGMGPRTDRKGGQPELMPRGEPDVPAAVAETAWVSRFGGEYGFLFKRLPVWRVTFDAPGRPRYYVEPSTGALAARVDAWDASEGQIFAWLHKWQFLDIDKDVRDALQAGFALANGLVAGMGLMVFMRRRRRDRPHAAG